MNRQNLLGAAFATEERFALASPSMTSTKDYALEWHPQKNKHLDPFSIAPYSQKAVWWLCNKSLCEKNCPHEWEAIICDRTRGSNCPFCSIPTRKVCQCNSLFAKRPDLMREWHETKNSHYDPKQLSVHSGASICWKCTFCDYEWIARPAARSEGIQRGCRRCNRFGGECSSGAKEVEKVLKDLKVGSVSGFTINYTPEKRLFGMIYKNPLYLDEYITSPQMKRPAAIEYDGQLHFWTKGRNAAEWTATVRRDLAKNKFLVQHKIHLLRISYKYPKYKIRNLIHNFLGEALFHEKVSVESYLKCSCPEVYKKLKADSLHLIETQQ